MASPRSANIKLLLLTIAVIIVVATLLYTQNLTKQLLKREHDVADLYAKSLEFIANSPSMDQSDYSFIFDEVIRSIDFPMILSDTGNNPLEPFYTSARNVRLDSSESKEDQREYLVARIRELDRQNPPISVIISASKKDSLIQFLHYGESRLITKLRWLPYIEISVAGMFIIIGYIGFSYVKRNEQSNLWVGMSKETAHQLGTPLSSLMGWVELLKQHANDNPKMMSTIAEMESDLGRLQIVTERFSKIGSKPNLKDENVHEVIESVITYFQRRLPSKYGGGKNFEISIATNQQPVVKINKELFGWVIENLVKNAIDAMDNSSGKVIFTIEEKPDGVYIDVRDTGKGIDLKSKQDIFRPGYSTKQRGWGLGLSLSKRIIESYHNGKIFVKESKVGKGTTFRIKLAKSKHR
ncbi:MAG TPA: HAMP domain-containing sensor histidine kinase [Bacteroidota bacterium]|jgi:signal transduction histidine kinase|nr:HAMP domain-containing sensor histidine kinase [Bacteroidota bacterium]